MGKFVLTFWIFLKKGPFPPDYSYARKESLCMAAAELFRYVILKHERRHFLKYFIFENSAAKQWEKAEALVQEVLNQMEKRNSTQSTSSVLKQVNLILFSFVVLSNIH